LLTNAAAGKRGCVKHPHDDVLREPRSPAGRVATTLTFSLTPKQLGLIRQRERELNMGRSSLLRVLFDVEEREGLLRKELRDRLNLQLGAL
jgi:hypothetical protein